MGQVSNIESCHQLLDDLSDYLDGQAADEICYEIERHMADCDNCRIVIDTLRKTILLYRALPQPEMPPAARQRLYRTFELEAYLALSEQ